MMKQKLRINQKTSFECRKVLIGFEMETSSKSIDSLTLKFGVNSHQLNKIVIANY